LSTSMMYAKLC